MLRRFSHDRLLRSAAAAVALATTAAFAPACRSGVNERCICFGDCRSGLVCAAGGRRLDQKGECLTGSSMEQGQCIPEDADANADDPLDPMPVFDFGTRRDFGWPPDGSSSDGSSSVTSASGTSTGTASSSTGLTDTNATTAGDTGETTAVTSSSDGTSSGSSSGSSSSTSSGT